MITKTQKQRLFRALDNIARVKDDKAIAKRNAERNNMVRTRMRDGKYEFFKDVSDDIKHNVHMYFHVYRWSFPNGSSGRNIQPIRHRNVVETWQGVGIYIESEDIVVLVDNTKKKVNASVDFGVHFYNGDIEMEDIKMSVMEKI
jgi:hypothetical protein